MKVVVVAPVGVPLPVKGYGGIEIAAQDLATELARRGHEVTLMGNVDDGPSPMGWAGRRILTEADPLTPDKYGLLRDADVVQDLSHGKAARLARTRQYWATTMFSDGQGPPGRNIYPSEAVRDSFKDPKAPVVPLGIPLDGVSVADPVPGRYVALGRVAPYKGQDLAIRVVRSVRAAEEQRDTEHLMHNPNPVSLTVAGHTGPFADAYFSLAVRKMCRDNGFDFVPDPPDLNALLDGAAGLLHLHRWVESFSLVAANALLRGIPILTTDVGAPQEFVRACDGGFVVPLKDLEAGRPEALAIARGFFEERWSSRRAGIAKRARELFDVRVIAEKYETLYGGK
ncbi:MAG: glycosyltransferase [Acidimicrobiales bacterium]|nr:glycosyltransferase [Acidimicrobiales bacterium]